METKSLLVGTGGWAENHLRAYAECEDIRVVGLVGHRDLDRLAALAEGYGIPESFLDLGEALDRTEPEMLDIACNPHFRLPGVREAVRAGVKLVNLEKPMALGPAEAYEIERLCRDSGVLLTVNHQKKYLPAWRRAKEMIQAGELGEIEHIRATCQGNLLEQGTHLVDMVLHYNDYAPVEWVMGQIDELEGLDKAGSSAPDAAMALLSFANGVRATLTIGSIGHRIPGETNKWHHYAVEVYGTQGRLRVTLNRTLEAVTRSGERICAESSWDKDFVHGLAAHLADAARYAQNPSVGHISELDRSMGSFQVIMAIYAAGCGEGIVSLPRRFDDSLMERLQDRRKTRI